MNVLRAVVTRRRGPRHGWCSRPASRPSRAAWRTRRADSSGFSLIEVMISIVLISTVILALATALLTMMKTTRVTSERQEMQLALTNYSERLKAVRYVDCATSTAYTASMAAAPPVPVRSGMVVDLVDVEYWNAATSTYAPACASVASDAGAQRLTVRVRWDGRESRAQIVKRDGSDTP